MTYREFTDKIEGTLGSVNWGLIGKLQKKYTKPFILNCVNKFPQWKLNNMTPQAKAVYLTGICNSDATPKDMLESNPINIEGFDV